MDIHFSVLIVKIMLLLKIALIKFVWFNFKILEPKHVQPIAHRAMTSHIKLVLTTKSKLLKTHPRTTPYIPIKQYNKQIITNIVYSKHPTYKINSTTIGNITIPLLYINTYKHIYKAIHKLNPSILTIKKHTHQHKKNTKI